MLDCVKYEVMSICALCLCCNYCILLILTFVTCSIEVVCIDRGFAWKEYSSIEFEVPRFTESLQSLICESLEGRE
jgi:hypothetical protein